MALLHLAHNEVRVASVREIAAAYQIPEALLSKIMQRLKGGGFVAAVHGNRGGYRLCRGLSEISLLDLTQTLVGPLRVVGCLDLDKKHCSVMPVCTIVTPMNVLNTKIAEFFQSTSLEALASKRVAT